MSKLLALLAVLSIALATGCGNATKEVTSTGSGGQVTTETVPDVKFAKTKFVLHTGLAFGAFHRYILKPYQAGSFKKGAPKRKRSLVKAGAAGLFAVRELKLARNAALSDDKLRPLAEKVSGLSDKLGGLASAFQGGSFNPAAILGAAGAATALGNDSKGAGAEVKDRAVPGF